MTRKERDSETRRVTLSSGDRARLDAQLVLGGVTETVTVAAEAPLLQTETSTVSALVDAERNGFRGPARSQVDLSIFRTIAAGDVDLQLRYEVYNLFNRVNFDNPSGAFGMPTFGRNSCPPAAAARMGCSGGGTGIRTLERVSPLTVFKTAAFDRSAIPPQDDRHPTGSITSSPPMYPRNASGITTDPSRC